MVATGHNEDGLEQSGSALQTVPTKICKISYAHSMTNTHGSLTKIPVECGTATQPHPASSAADSQCKSLGAAEFPAPSQVINEKEYERQGTLKLAYNIQKGKEIEKCITYIVPLLHELVTAAALPSSTQTLSDIIAKHEFDVKLTSPKSSKSSILPRTPSDGDWSDLKYLGLESPNQGLDTPLSNSFDDSEDFSAPQSAPTTPEHMPFTLLLSSMFSSHRSPSIRRARPVKADTVTFYSSDPFAADSSASLYFSPPSSPGPGLAPRSGALTKAKGSIYCKRDTSTTLLAFPSLPGGAQGHGKIEVKVGSPERKRTRGMGRAPTRMQLGRNYSYPSPRCNDPSDLITRSRAHTNARDRPSTRKQDAFIVTLPVTSDTSFVSDVLRTTPSAPTALPSNACSIWVRRATSKMAHKTNVPEKEMPVALTSIIIPVHALDDEDSDEEDIFDPLTTPKASEYEWIRKSPENIFVYGLSPPATVYIPPPPPVVGIIQRPRANAGGSPTIREGTERPAENRFSDVALSDYSVMDIIAQFPDPPSRNGAYPHQRDGRPSERNGPSLKVHEA